MKIVYIAHPIAGNVKGNIRKILSIIRHINLTQPGVVPFAPYLADVMAMDDNNPDERARGIANDRELLLSGIVNELWVCSERISLGMRDEIDLAKAIGIPICHKKIVLRKDL